MRSRTDQSVLSMDEAYRRLGHKLSQRVTSGEDYRASVALNLGSHPFTAFSSNPQQVASNTHANQVRSPMQFVQPPPRIMLTSFLPTVSNNISYFESRTNEY
jgi:hypothetical protein